MTDFSAFELPDSLCEKPSTPTKYIPSHTLSIEQECALQQFENSDNLFITGEGGTGKTLLIRHLVQ